MKLLNVLPCQGKLPANARLIQKPGPARPGKKSKDNDGKDDTGEEKHARPEAQKARRNEHRGLSQPGSKRQTGLCIEKPRGGREPMQYREPLKNVV